jgi:hypothetical protein
VEWLFWFSFRFSFLIFRSVFIPPACVDTVYPIVSFLFLAAEFILVYQIINLEVKRVYEKKFPVWFLTDVSQHLIIVKAPGISSDDIG